MKYMWVLAATAISTSALADSTGTVNDDVQRLRVSIPYTDITEKSGLPNAELVTGHMGFTDVTFEINVSGWGGKDCVLIPNTIQTPFQQFVRWEWAENNVALKVPQSLNNRYSNLYKKIGFVTGGINRPGSYPSANPGTIRIGLSAQDLDFYVKGDCVGDSWDVRIAINGWYNYVPDVQKPQGQGTKTKRLSFEVVGRLTVVSSTGGSKSTVTLNDAYIARADEPVKLGSYDSGHANRAFLTLTCSGTGCEHLTVTDFPWNSPTRLPRGSGEIRVTAGKSAGGTVSANTVRGQLELR